MFIKKTILAILITSVLFVPKIKAGIAVDLLDAATGARPLAMGGAFTALSGSAAAPAYNPAGLAQLKKTEISSSSFSSFEGDLTSISFDLAHPINNGILGINIIRKSINDIPYTESINNHPNILGSINTEYDCFNISFATAYPDNQLYLGGNLKYLSYNLSQASASSFGMDFGLIYKASNDLKLGLVARNILPVSLEWSTGHKDEFNLKVQSGIAFKQRLFGKLLLSSLDIDLLNNSRSNTISYGFEYWVYNSKLTSVTFRFGKNRVNHITAGSGLYFRHLRIDYAYQYHQLGSSNIITLGYQF